MGLELPYAGFKSLAVAQTYGALIAAFLAGTQWGISITPGTDRTYFLISNVLALLAWFNLLVFTTLIGMVLLLVCFVLALVGDHQAHKHQQLPGWYWPLRQRITVIVVNTLLVLILISF